MHDCIELISDMRIRENLNIRDQDEVHVVLHS
jgi:CTP-dependent riboflavin kinase